MFKDKSIFKKHTYFELSGLHSFISIKITRFGCLFQEKSLFQYCSIIDVLVHSNIGSKAVFVINRDKGGGYVNVFFP